MKKLQKTFIGLIILDFLGCIGGVLFGAILIFLAGAIILPIVAFILLLRLLGLHRPADRLCAWGWKRTTRFTLK